MGILWLARDERNWTTCDLSPTELPEPLGYNGAMAIITIGTIGTIDRLRARMCVLPPNARWLKLLPSVPQP